MSREKHGPRGWKDKLSVGMKIQLVETVIINALALYELSRYNQFHGGHGSDSTTMYIQTEEEKVYDCERSIELIKGASSWGFRIISLAAIASLTGMLLFPLYHGMHGLIWTIVGFRKGKPVKFGFGYTMLSGIMANYLGLRKIHCDRQIIWLALDGVAPKAYLTSALCLWFITLLSIFVILGYVVMGVKNKCSFCCMIFIYLLMLIAAVSGLLSKAWSTFSDFSLAFGFKYTLPSFLAVATWIDAITSLYLDLWLWRQGDGCNEEESPAKSAEDTDAEDV